ncbi:MAG: TonB-dependent receptor plug domain-containing protein [Sediminibacterium sp.]
MKIFFLIFCFTTSVTLLQAQSVDSVVTALDTIPNVLVESFNARVKWKEAAIAMSSINQADILRTAPNSIVPVFNTMPGIRLEERSPGSYRLSIRGSLLRSPFGVRNVKVYWNNLPISDATGNAYLNLIDLSQITGAEIIKGPASSLYGAGTGGVVLLQSQLKYKGTITSSFSVGMNTGSFGLIQENASWQYQSKNFSSNLTHNYLQSQGYRDQSALKKQGFKYEAAFKMNAHQFQLLSWYTNMYYQTPGGINLAQMLLNPQLSRQASGSLPSAIQQQAGIYNKTSFLGIQDQWKLATNWHLNLFSSVQNTRFENPFITNYEYRNETNTSTGMQLVMHPITSALQWITGFEWLNNHSNIDDYGNKNGIADTVQFKDNIFANQWLIYSQLQTVIAFKWHFNFGISINQQQYLYKRLTDIQTRYIPKSTNWVPAPRVSALYEINKNIATYFIAGYGFSPASLAEVRPSDGNYYSNLLPEKGWNIELGLKGFLINNQLQFNLSYYHFALQDAIVRRNNAAGAEYFINAGGTIQQGFEAMLQYHTPLHRQHFLQQFKCYSSYSFQPYYFSNYQQLTINYTGNAITGVPKNSWATGMDFIFKKHWELNTTINCISTIPLTDANDVFADAYQLVQLKLQYSCLFNKTKVQFFSGVDNALNQLYSLGNDINAAGKRYYNPAPKRNFYFGMAIKFN